MMTETRRNRQKSAGSRDQRLAFLFAQTEPPLPLKCGVAEDMRALETDRMRARGALKLISDDPAVPKETREFAREAWERTR